MSLKAPEFHLARVFEDGTSEAPSLFRLSSIPWDTKMNRRGAVGASIGLVGVASLLVGCAAKPRSANAPAAADSTCAASRGLRAHTSKIVALELTRDGKTLISQCDDGKVKLWELPNGNLSSTLDTTAKDPNGIALSPAGDRLVTQSPHHAILWSVPEGRLVATIKDGALAFSPDGRLFATYDPNGALTLLNSADGKTVALINTDAAGSSLNGPSFSPDGTLLVSSSYTAPVRLWSVPEARPVGVLPDEKVVRVHMVPHGPMLITVASGKTTFRSLPDLKVRASVSDGGGWTELSPDQRLLGFWNHDEKLRVRSTIDGRVVMSIDGRNPVFSPDGKHVVVQAPGGGRTAHELWAIEGPRRLAHLDAYGPVAFTSDGQKLLAFSEATLKVWSVLTGKLIEQAPVDSDAPSSTIQRVAVSADGKTAILGTSDGAIAITDIETACSAFAFDPSATATGLQAHAYNVYDARLGRWLTYTLPCGSPLPPGATCTCNCVPGTFVAKREPTPWTAPTRWVPSTTTQCTCNKVCTCVPVYSSRRWKTNIESLGGALEQVTSLRGVRFSWTDDAPHRPPGADLGLIAEEVANVVPELVARDTAGAPVAVDYARMTALLIEAVKAQQAQIEELRSALRALETISGAKRAGVPKPAQPPRALHRGGASQRKTLTRKR